MRVTRITIDADLGLIELQTGPGGDGNYVLLPIDVPPTAERYLRIPGEPCEAEAPEEKESLVEEFLRTPGKFFGGEAIVAPGGWCVPADQAYDFNTTPGVGAYDAEIADPPKIERGGYLYPGSKAARERELNSYLAADTDECDGNCGAHPVTEWQEPETGPGKGYTERKRKGRADDVWTRAPGEGEPSKERHTGPATIANPIRVFADEHSRGYRLHSPALPGWRADINRYDLHKVPGMIREALVDMGSDHAINYPVTITVMEEEQ